MATLTLGWKQKHRALACIGLALLLTLVLLCPPTLAQEEDVANKNDTATADDANAGDGNASSALPNPSNTKTISKSDCEAKLPYEAFAVDDSIISCVRDASDECCDAMDSHLGSNSSLHLCTCSQGVLEKVLSQAVPAFAEDLIRERVIECGLPVAGDPECQGLYEDSDEMVEGGAGAAGNCTDEAPESTSYTCEEEAQFGKCEEGWMQGYCLLSCGRCGDAAATDAAPEATGTTPAGIEVDPTLEPSANCTDIAPESTSYTCEEEAGYGKCDEGFMSGFCLLSCGKCIPLNGTDGADGKAVVESTSDNEDESTTNEDESTTNEDESTTNEGEDTDVEASSVDDTDCPDDPPGDTPCVDEANNGKCDRSWMEGFCLKSCGKCVNDTSTGLDTSAVVN